MSRLHAKAGETVLVHGASGGVEKYYSTVYLVLCTVSLFCFFFNQGTVFTYSSIHCITLHSFMNYLIIFNFLP